MPNRATDGRLAIPIIADSTCRIFSTCQRPGNVPKRCLLRKQTSKESLFAITIYGLPAPIRLSGAKPRVGRQPMPSLGWQTFDDRETVFCLPEFQWPSETVDKPSYANSEPRKGEYCE